MVKGAGFRSIGGNAPLSDQGQIFDHAARAEKALRSSVRQGIQNPDAVYKSLNPSFMAEYGLFMGGMQTPQTQALGAFVSQVQAAMADLGKNITLTSPLASGFVPFDLMAPSRLIYPVFSPFRNKLPRVQGQGTSRRAKVVTGIAGTNTPAGSNPFLRWSIGETNPASAYPGTLPAAGTSTAVDLNIPYKFFGMSESLSWLAQFAGQGFEDVTALANLILMQEAMMAEEATLLAGTGTNIVAPANPSLAARSAGAGETGLSGLTTNIFVKVTATNMYGGETTAQTSGATIAAVDGQVVDVTIAPSLGATLYNIYVTTGASAGTYHIMVTGAAGAKYTLQGAIPVSGAAPPVSNNTASATDYEGLWSILSGHAVTDAAVYPAGFKAGYINQSVGTVLNTTALNAALVGLWDGSGAFRANPAELVCEGGDAKRLSDDILSKNGQSGAYQFQIQQSDVGNITAGAAVSQFQNPVTRDLVRIMVHPWFPQGSAMLMSYTLPQAYSNVSNVWEVVNVQDYVSVAWPVIDPTFRYSLFCYGALVGYGPQYCGLLQGLQVNGAAPWS